MDRRRSRGEAPPDLKPVDVDGVRTVAIITVLWALAFVVLAFRRNELDDAGRGWWIWTCLAGVGLGLLGLEYCRKRRDAIARAELDEEADADFDDAGEWADGELAALAADDDSADLGFEQPTQAYSPYDRTPPAAPLPFDPPPPPQPAPTPTPPPGYDTSEHTGTYSPRGRPPPGYVTGDFPAVSGEFPAVSGQPRSGSGEFPAVRDDSPAGGNVPPGAPYPPPQLPARPPRPSRAAASGPQEPAHPDRPYGTSAAPAGYSPDPDHSRRHPRDEELARRYREEQARATAAGYEPPTYPEFLQDEAARHGDAAWRGGPSPEQPRADQPSLTAEPPRPEAPQPPPADPGPPPPRRRTVGFDSEFFGDEPAGESSHGADFLLDEDEPDSDYRGRRARRD
ncbi:MAG TPA: DUF2530 domain-containing protein [Jiangellaceae bacterium]